MSESSEHVKEVLPSRIWLKAWIAAEEALPEASLKLIQHYDTLADAWRDAGWPSPVPPEIRAASKVIEADPLASIAFECRRRCNDASADEYNRRSQVQPERSQVQLGNEGKVAA